MRAYQQRTGERDALIRMLVHCAGKFQGDAHIFRNARSVIEEYYHELGEPPAQGRAVPGLGALPVVLQEAHAVDRVLRAVPPALRDAIGAPTATGPALAPPGRLGLRRRLRRQRAGRVHLRRLGAGGHHPRRRDARRPERRRSSSSWIFGAFFVNGLISIAFCWFYRQPLVFFWSIPGAVLVGPALGHLTFPEVIGAFLATGVLMLALGLSGWVRRAMEAVPMPIVMGMVAGVFLRFGLDLVFAIRDEFWIAAPMTAVFLGRDRVARGSAASPAAADRRDGRRRRHDRRARRASTRRPEAAASRGPTSTRRRSPGRRWSSWWCRSRSRCWWCRTGRASPCCAPPGTSRRSTRSPSPAARARCVTAFVGAVSDLPHRAGQRDHLGRGREAAAVHRGHLRRRARARLRARSARVHAAHARHARAPSSRRSPASRCCACCRRPSPSRSGTGSRSARSSRFSSPWPTSRSSASARRSGGSFSASRRRWLLERGDLAVR